MTSRLSQVIEGVSHLDLEQHGDERGFFMETFRASWFPGVTFVQGNLSRSAAGVLRGLHYHLHQDDLWLVPAGTAFAALVDLRRDSSTYLAVETFDLSGGRAVYIPTGVAHGFYARDDLLMTYLVTNYYDGSDELGVAWDDPSLGVSWPTADPVLSARDRNNVRWAEVAVESRPGGAR